MRLLLYNPNTNQELTSALGQAARRLLRHDDVLQLATSNSGQAFIGSEESIASARAAICINLPSRATDCDAVLLACFGDIGVDQVRHELKRPVVSLSDAFFAAAPFLGRRLGVLTTSEFWVDRLTIEAKRKGASSWIAEMVSLNVSADETTTSLRTRSQSIVAEIAATGRCEAVVFAGALLASLSADMAKNSPMPLIDALATGIGLCRAAHQSLAQPSRF